MSLAIKTVNGDFIYFDAVTAYTPSYSNMVTKHPVDGGGFISDHYVDDNPSFNISGIISDADFNWTDRPQVGQQDALRFNVGTIRFVNNNPVIAAVEVNSNSKDKFFNLPDVLGLSNSPKTPNVSMTTASTEEQLYKIKQMLIDLRDGVKNQNTNNLLVSLIEFDGNQIIDVHDDCVITSLSFPESPETGTCLSVEITLEKVRFVTLTKTAIPQSTVDAIKDKASAKDSKGKQIKPAVTASTGPTRGKVPKSPRSKDRTSAFIERQEGGT